jgi:hypothetical protein
MSNQKVKTSGSKRMLSRQEMKAITGGAAPQTTCPLNCGTGCTEENACACKGSPNTYCVAAGSGHGL